jgi:hypothetical protein
MQQAGDIPDPRDAQILRLKTDFRAQAIASLAAQHEEITNYDRQIHPHQQNRADNDMVDATNHHRH